MGWVNYILIENWKLAIEMPRYVEDLMEDKYRLLTELFEKNDDLNSEMWEGQIGELSVAGFSELLEKYRLLFELGEMSAETGLLFFLRNREIRYEIVTEHAFNSGKYVSWTVVPTENAGEISDSIWD